MKFVMNHAPGSGSIALPVDQQSSALPLSYGCTLICRICVATCYKYKCTNLCHLSPIITARLNEHFITVRIICDKFLFCELTIRQQEIIWKKTKLFSTNSQHKGQTFKIFQPNISFHIYSIFFHPIVGLISSP